MTRNAVIMSLFGLIAFSASTVRGDESAPLMEYYGWFLGQWDVTESGDPGTVGSLTVTEAPGQRCQYVVFQSKSNKAVALWGYDGGVGSWVGTGYSSDGAYWRDVLEKTTAERIKPGDSWNSRVTSVAVDGTKTSEISEWKIVDENTVVVKTTERIAGNQKLPDQETRYVRRKPAGQ